MMQKTIIFILLLCLHYSARGQTSYEYRYWFDDDISSAETGSTTSNAWHLEVDLNRLTESFHTIHLQVTDEKGVSSPPVSRCFFLSREDGRLQKGFYWFDNEKKARTVKGDPQGTLTFDITELQEGFHTLHYQVLRTDGLYSQIVTRSFYKVQSDQAMGYLNFMFYIDGTLFKNERILAENGEATCLLDVKELPIGFHKLQVKAIMDNGASTSNREAFFLRSAMDSELDAMTCICSVDGKVFKQEKMQATNGAATWQIDVSELPIGFHRMQVRAVMENGASTSIREAFFLRNAMDSELNALSCLFSIDGKPYKTVESGISNGVFHCDLDVASLSEGLHKISYMLTNGQGSQTTVKSQYFIKQPLGGNSIKKYQYWLNDNDDQAHLVTQNKVTDPLSLITMLPIEQQPLRSSLFHFDVKDGQPMMYAKNELHMRFYDSAGRFTDASEQFIDYQVGQEVEISQSLNDRIGTIQLEKPEENTVVWYTMECAKGDSIAIQSSQATTMQIFSPTGAEMFNVSGSESVKMDGIHTNENGIYYIALHDVTGSKTDMSLKYQHIDKYDFFGSSNAVFGVLPSVQILEIDGNGFDNLKSVQLCNGDNIIQVDSIACIDKSKARLYMLLNGDEPYGKYDLVLNFDDGEDARTITNKKYVTLCEPSFENIEISVNTPQSTITPYPVTITLKNPSNIAYQAVPFYFAIDHMDCIENIRFVDFSLCCPTELYENGLQLSFDYDNFKNGKSQTTLVPALIPEIMPGETQVYTLSVTFSNRQPFKVYAWTSRPWNMMAPETIDFVMNDYAKIMSKSKKRAPGAAGIFDGCEDDPCSLAGPLSVPAECACGTALALGGTLGGIQNALHNRYNRGSRDFLIRNGLRDDAYDNFQDRYLPSPADLWWYWLQHCLPGHAGEAASAYNSSQQMRGNNPCPDPPPHQANPYAPADPNDIYGYLSEAGSKFMPDSVETINYTIEFENDTTLATASAHTIIVRDTLDSHYFDLMTFVPTGIKIGEHELLLNRDNDLKISNGVLTFVKTIDMRSEINAIAQVECNYSQKTGIATWTFTSLDPMTMEPTDDIMQGILPVNYNGTVGIGEVMFEIGVKPNKGDGAEISNRASITFDYEAPIMTPSWTNIVDAVAPESYIQQIVVNDTIMTLRLNGSDNRSGIWHYNVYVQEGEDAPWRLTGENITESFYKFVGKKDINYGFCVVATDLAGNVEKKTLSREGNFGTITRGDVNNDNVVDISDIVAIINSIAYGKDYVFYGTADVNIDNKVDISDIVTVINIIAGKN